MPRSEPSPSDAQGDTGRAQDYLDHFVPFHLYRVTTRAAARATKDYRALGISVPEARLLMVVLMAGTLSAGALSEMLSVEASLLSHMMRHLVAKGLIQRARDASHRRSIQISLTEEGERCARTCRALSSQHEAELLAGLSESEKRTLSDLLDRLYLNTLKHGSAETG